MCIHIEIIQVAFILAAATIGMMATEIIIRMAVIKYSTKVIINKMLRTFLKSRGAAGGGYLIAICGCTQGEPVCGNVNNSFLI